MKTIIVAIDFSKGSIHALEYAIRFANHVKSNIHLVWVDNITTDETVYSHFSNEDKLEHKKSFEKLFRKYRSKLSNGNLSYCMRRGKVHMEIAKVASQEDADLIIAGTHGVTGFEEYWIGSNAYRIVTSAPCPVITIRNDFDSDTLVSSIVFPIDSTVETRQKLPFTANIARIFNAAVHILGLYSTTLKSVQKRIDSYVDNAAKYFEENQVHYKVKKFKPDNITQSIIKYAEDNNAHLIAIMTEQEGTTGHVFLGPHAQQLINHSPIPILSLKSKEIIKLQTH